jgi:hypothetical protein
MATHGLRIRAGYRNHQWMELGSAYDEVLDLSNPDLQEPTTAF